METLLLNDGAVALGFLAVFGLFALAMLALWIYCIVDIVQSEFKEKNGQLIWLLIVIFTHPIGSIVYLVLRDKQKAEPLDVL